MTLQVDSAAPTDVDGLGDLRASRRLDAGARTRRAGAARGAWCVTSRCRTAGGHHRHHGQQPEHSDTGWRAETGRSPTRHVFSPSLIGALRRLPRRRNTQQARGDALNPRDVPRLWPGAPPGKQPSWPPDVERSRRRRCRCGGHHPQDVDEAPALVSTLDETIWSPGKA
jgi:hypothetical protein